MSEALPVPTPKVPEIPEVPESPAAPVPAAKTPNPERYKTLVVVLTILTTVITAIIAGLQADANIRASIANRDSQVYAIQAAGELHRQGLEWAYEMNVLSSYLKDSQESNIMQLTALQQSDAGTTNAGDASMLLALMDQSRANAAEKFSIFFTDPRYTAKSDGGLPDMKAYLLDSVAKTNGLVDQQNAAADEYDRWNHKGDVYTSVLAVLAVAFFLFGLGQALAPKLRLLMAAFGLVALLAAVLWTVVILVG